MKQDFYTQCVKEKTYGRGGVGCHQSTPIPLVSCRLDVSRLERPKAWILPHSQEFKVDFNY